MKVENKNEVTNVPEALQEIREDVSVVVEDFVKLSAEEYQEMKKYIEKMKGKK